MFWEYSLQTLILQVSSIFISQSIVWYRKHSAQTFMRCKCLSTFQHCMINCHNIDVKCSAMIHYKHSRNIWSHWLLTSIKHLKSTLNQYLAHAIRMYFQGSSNSIRNSRIELLWPSHNKHIL